MSRTNIDIDDRACAEVMRRYRLPTRQEAVNFALRTLAAEPALADEARLFQAAEEVREYLAEEKASWDR